MSDMLSFSPGAATSGSSGSIMVGTGEAMGGKGGILHMTVVYSRHADGESSSK